jgi:hypothetical protein
MGRALGLATFRLDVAYTQVAAALAVDGLETVLLKGPALDQLLFAGVRQRDYADIDLLVDPGHVSDAGRSLERLGFHRAATGPLKSFGRRVGEAVGLLDRSHATAWIRDRDRFTVDLHHTLPLVRAGASEVWRAVAAHRATITVVGSQVQTIDGPASALLIALHAAHHGPSWRRIHSDLERACEVLGPDCWRDARDLAEHLQADRAMGIGLGTTPAGRAIANELGLRTEPTFSYRLIWPVTAWIDRRRTATG